MEELTHTDSEVRRIKYMGFMLGMMTGALIAVIVAAVLTFTPRPAHAAPRDLDASCHTTFTYNHHTGVVTINAKPTLDMHKIYKYRLVTADGVFHDYPRADVGHYTSRFSIRAPRNLWAVTAWRGTGNCGAVMFGGVA